MCGKYEEIQYVENMKKCAPLNMGRRNWNELWVLAMGLGKILDLRAEEGEGGFGFTNSEFRGYLEEKT